MLPRPHRLGPPHFERLAGLPCAHGVRDQPILRPVAAADDVAGARAGHRHTLYGEVRVAIAADDDLARGFAGAVRIVAAERIVFGIGAPLATLAVDLIGGDHHRDAHAVDAAQGVEHIGGAHD